MNKDQEVTWTSTSAGSTIEKTGVIEAIVPAGKTIADVLPLSKAKSEFTVKNDYKGNPRDHKSYVVSVPGNSERSKRQLYWPRASLLKPSK